MLNQKALLTAALICTLLFLFIVIGVANLSFGSVMRSLDQSLISSLRVQGQDGDPIGPDWFEEAARDITALGSVSSLGLIVVIGITLLLSKSQVRAAIAIANASIGCFLFNSLLKSFFDRPRPTIVPHEAVVFTPSFPSGHAMVSASTFATMALLLAGSSLFIDHTKRIFLIAAISIFLIGSSRVYLGVHWPSDVIAGWAAGVAWSCLTIAFIHRHQLSPSEVNVQSKNEQSKIKSQRN